MTEQIDGGFSLESQLYCFAMLNIPTTEERLGHSPQRLVRWFVLFMSLLYIILGVWLWVGASYPSAAGALIPLNSTARQILGAVFFGYGVLRFIRTYRLHFRKSSNSSNSSTLHEAR